MAIFFLWSSFFRPTSIPLQAPKHRPIKGLGNNPQKSELIYWRQCLLSGGTEACSFGLLEIVACIDKFQINEINVDLRTSGFDNEVLSVDACAVW